MFSKKIFLSAAFVSMAGFVACGDDSSSNAGDGSNNIPEKVETIDKAIHLNCTEEIKCTMVYVEEVKDNFFCNGTKFEPYSPVLNAKDCPAEEENKGEEGTEEGDNKSEGSEEGDNGDSTEDGSSSSGATSTDSNTDGEEGGEGAEGGEGGEGTEEGGEGSEKLTGPTGDLYSCLQDSEIMGMRTKICTETTANSTTAAGLKETCTSFDYEGMKITSTEGTGCSAETGYVKKCVVSNDAAVYYFDADAADKSCEELTKKD